MKLRIRSNTLRLRISRSEIAVLVEHGAVEDTIHFSAAPEAKLVYALELAPSDTAIRVEYVPQRVTVLLSTEAANRWASTDAVGIYGTVATSAGPLALTVEKDFACLDRNDPDDEDAFPNPNAGAVC